MRELREGDTKPEIAVRKLLYSSGCRYRIHYRIPEIPRRSIDIAFPKAKLAVFIDGCFWHGCAIHKTIPKNNRAWWQEKILSNKKRDSDTNERLGAAGWLVLRFWEHDSPDLVVHTINEMLRESRLQKTED